MSTVGDCLLWTVAGADERRRGRPGTLLPPETSREGIAMGVPKIVGAAGLLAVAALAVGCSSGEPAADVVVSSSAPVTSASSPAPASSPAAPMSSSAAPKTTTMPAAAAPSGGNCGTVTAASGLTLQVLDSSSLGVSCADAKQLVGKFQAQIAGKQAANSNEPVSATVDGWLCVSGPPAAQGGTSCSEQDKTVFASVAAE
jgi:hypothetical protein